MLWERGAAGRAARRGEGTGTGAEAGVAVADDSRRDGGCTGEATDSGRGLRDRPSPGQPGRRRRDPLATWAAVIRACRPDRSTLACRTRLKKGRRCAAVSFRGRHRQPHSRPLAPSKPSTLHRRPLDGRGAGSVPVADLIVCVVRWVVAMPMAVGAGSNKLTLAAAVAAATAAVAVAAVVASAVADAAAPGGGGMRGAPLAARAWTVGPCPWRCALCRPVVPRSGADGGRTRRASTRRGDTAGVWGVGGRGGGGGRFCGQRRRWGGGRRRRQRQWLCVCGGGGGGGEGERDWEGLARGGPCPA